MDDGNKRVAQLVPPSRIHECPARPDDSAKWLLLRQALWPDGSEAEHREEIDQFFAGEFPRDPWAVLLAEDTDKRVLGLVQLSLRPYAEGCRNSPVAYLEGWFVLPEARRRGVGRALIVAAETWGPPKAAPSLLRTQIQKTTLAGLCRLGHGTLFSKGPVG